MQLPSSQNTVPPLRSWVLWEVIRIGGNSNPDVFADSSGYRGFRLRLGIRSVEGQAPSPCLPIIDTVEVSGKEVPL